MTGAVIGVLLVVAAVWVAVPGPRQQLRRLDSRTSRGTFTSRGALAFSVGGGLAGLLHGKVGALPLKVRVLLGLVVAGVLLARHPPGPASVSAAVAVLIAVVVGGGRLSLKTPSTLVSEAELADTIELMAVCLAAGTPMRHALEVVTDVSGTRIAPVLARVSGQLAMGVAEQQAWLELAEDDAWGPVARDIARSARSGTSLVDVLHVHADEARLLAQERALQKARGAGVRSVVPLMACFLPAFVLVGVLPIVAGLLGGLLSP